MGQKLVVGSGGELLFVIKSWSVAESTRKAITLLTDSPWCTSRVLRVPLHCLRWRSPEAATSVTPCRGLRQCRRTTARPGTPGHTALSLTHHPWRLRSLTARGSGGKPDPLSEACHGTWSRHCCKCTRSGPLALGPRTSSRYVTKAPAGGHRRLPNR